MQSVAALPTHTLVVYNQLFRNEMSAVETYNQVLEKFHGNPCLDPLARIRDEHMRSAGDIMEFILVAGGTPDTDAATWGLFAKALQAAANLFGEDSAVEILQRGEAHGRRLYERAHADEKIPSECRDWIHNTILPQIQGQLLSLAQIRRR